MLLNIQSEDKANTITEKGGLHLAAHAERYIDMEDVVVGHLI